MAWNHSAVTNSGIEMLNEMMAGRKLQVTNAYGGTGIVDLEAETLEEQTGLVELRQQLAVLEVENTAEGKIVCIQVSNMGLETGYRLQQVSVCASLDGAEERTLFILQDETGADIPSETETPDFLLEIYALIRMTNSVKLTVAVDGAGVATRKYVQTYVTEALKEVAGSTTAEGAPGAETPGTPGQHYFDTASGTEYVCTGTAEDGTYIWEVSGAGAVKEHNEDPNAHAEIIEEAVDAAFQRLVEDGTVIDKAEVERLIKSATNGTGGVFSGILALTMPVDGWALADTPKGKYIYFCDVAAEGVTADHWPTGGVNLEDEDAAQAAGVGGGCDTFDGYIRFYSKVVPEQDIRATIVLFVQGSAGSGDTIAQDMLGDGLTVTGNGKLAVAVGNGLSVDEEGRVSVDVSTDAEAGSAIDGVFDGNT